MDKMYDHDATYSPEDNKLRLYPGYRLDKPLYNQIREAGFRWAPKQELFVAPMWTPGREDILIELCGEIGDEDTSLVDRAEIRSERFDEYSDKRKQDADSAHDYVKSITSGIPLGQPILVGHHSEKRARKDAERIENGMRKAVKMWETSKYWEYRAKGALRHAKYKERPDVRARRIKKIEASKRKQEKNIKACRDEFNLWMFPIVFTRSRAMAISNTSQCFYSFSFSLDKYPREPPASQYEGSMSLWSAMDGRVITHKQARNIVIPNLERSTAYAKRWLNHYENRLIYEKAMLGEQGRLDLIEKKPRPKQLPLLNYRAPEGITVINPDYYAEKVTAYPQFEMTKAEYKALYSGTKGVRKVSGTHRIKICSGFRCPAYMKAAPADGLDRTNYGHRSVAIFLTDSKVHEKPEPTEPAPTKVDRPIRRTQTYTPPERTEFDDMKDSLKEGVKVVSAPQLFETPHAIADEMVEHAEIEYGDRILEPQGGTGRIIDAIYRAGFKGNVSLDVVEKNYDLCSILTGKYHIPIIIGDFLDKVEFELGGKFDRIIMNPPFINGSDIKHIEHALTLLKPGGRLVALCANGPRQQAKLKPIADHWEVLPARSFKESGTIIDVALLIINK